MCIFAHRKYEEDKKPEGKKKKKHHLIFSSVFADLLRKMPEITHME